jgi:hypothetical protein
MSRHIMLKFLTFLIICMVHIQVAICLDVEVSSKAVSCNGGSDGLITVKLTGVESNTSIRLLSAKNNRLLKSLSSNIDTTLSFNGFIASDYIIQLVNNGKSDLVAITVTEPLLLQANAMVVEKYPSSKEMCDGIIKVEPKGGTPPYSFNWIEGVTERTEIRLSDLCEGIYTCEISDANNCQTVKVTSYLFQGFNKE